MKLARVRAGGLLALAGAVCVIVSLFVRNYEGANGALDAWRTFDAGVALLLLAAAAAIALFALTLFERSPALPMAVEVATLPLGIAALIAALVRLLERPNGSTEVCIGAWLALVGAAAILAGAWQSTRDERRSLHSAATPPPRPRP
ncbi:MAG TPA: hypothetical protein VH081_06030 [Solirubrobacteraceae bacterium]|jgi:hypothetical protein|nr:hypothetical protein [Solirubrobacteraceae bacterium]